MIALVAERGPRLRIAPTCTALGLARATFYWQRGRSTGAPVADRERRPPRQALAPAEREAVLAVLHEERFVDLPPAQVWAQLLDAGQAPPCSIRTMYRVLAAHQEVRERRNQPNEVWSWDITKLPGPVKWTYFYLLLAVRDARHLQPVHGGLAPGAAGGGRPGQGAHR